MADLYGKFGNKVRVMFLLYSVDNYIHFIKEYREIEKHPIKYGALKIQMIFNNDDDLANNLIKKWKQMGNNFTRFFLNLSTSNQKGILDYFQIPNTGKKNLSEANNADTSHYDNCALMPDSLEDINQLLFYFNHRNLDHSIANIQLPNLPNELEKKLANGSNWADYIISLPYEKQVFVLLLIIHQN